MYENCYSNFNSCCPPYNISCNYCCTLPYPPYDCRQRQTSECVCQQKLIPVDYRKFYNMPSRTKPQYPTIDLSGGYLAKLNWKSPKAQKTRKNASSNEKELEENQNLEADGTRRGSNTVTYTKANKKPHKSAIKEKNSGREKKPVAEEENKEKKEKENNDDPQNQCENLINKTSSGCLSCPSQKMCKSDSDINCDNICVYKCCCQPANKPRNGSDMLIMPYCGMPYITDSKCMTESSSCDSQNLAINNSDHNYNNYLMATVRQASRTAATRSYGCSQTQRRRKANYYSCCCAIERPAALLGDNSNNSCRCNCKKTAGRPKRYKSITPLGVIDEDEAETEMQDTCLKDEEKHQPSQNSDKINDMQKSLEDSCTDLLNIVTDNVLESVRKYVSATMQEYYSKTIEKIETINNKLEQHQQTMCCLYGNIVEQIALKNQNDLKEIYSLLTQLKQGQDNRPDTSSKIVYEHRESQCDAEVMNESAEQAKPAQIITESLSNRDNENVNEVKDNDKAVQKLCQCCPACGGRRQMVKTIRVHKSYSSSTVIQNPISCDSDFSLGLTVDQCDDDQQYDRRESGGGTNELEEKCKKDTKNPKEISLVNGNLGEIEALYVREKSVELLNRFADKTNLVENDVDFEPNISSGINTTTALNTTAITSSSSTGITPSATRPNSPNIFTCFSIKPSGKTVSNCKCFSAKPIRTESKAVGTSELYSYENYDTSGYASEPNDDNVINARSATPKEIAKTLPVHLQYVRRDENTICNEIPIRIKAKVKKENKRRSSKGSKSIQSVQPTPTRLSRL